MQRFLMPTLVATVLSSPALAQDSNLMLEEVIVTAQKKSESLADTPMTVNVIDAEAMNEFANFNIQDIDKMTAGISVSGNGYDIDIAVRGLGTNLTAPVDPRVGLYVNGASIAQERGFFTGIYDLERFELLRGPQGTLYGKASPAGALLMQTRRPNTQRMDGYVQQVFTEHSGSNTQLGVSIPLIEDELALRIAGLYDTNENQDMENVTLGKDGEVETWSGRATLAWQPSTQLDISLMYQRIEDEIDVDQIVDGNGFDYADRKAVNDFDSYLENTMELGVLELNYEFDNGWNLTSISSWQDNELDRYWDSDQSEIRAQEQFVSSNLRDVWNSELRLASVGNDKLDWTIGGFYQDSTADTPVFARNYVAPAPGFNVVAFTEGPANTDSETWALFGHTAWHFTESTTLTLGLRYTDYERYQSQPFSILPFAIAEDGSLTGPLADLSFNGVAEQDQNLNDDAFTGTIKLQHRFNDDLMAYASYDRGYRDGSANIAGRAEPQQFSGFDGEDSDNLEIGMKLDFLDGRALLAVAGYYQIYTDFHFLAEGVAYSIPPEEGGGTTFANPVVNVDEAESYGVEADLTFLVNEFWSWNLTASYNNTEFTDAKGVPCTNGEPLPPGFFTFNTCDLEGERAGRLPEWSGTANTEFWQPLSDSNLQWYVRGLFKAESEFYSQGLKEDLDSYAFIDLFAGIRSSDQTWEVSIWLKNATDEEARLEALRAPPLPDFENSGEYPNPYEFVRTQLDPRTLGLTASYRF
jgi:outer membrane receptor protein involved in Fe transport